MNEVGELADRVVGVRTAGDELRAGEVAEALQLGSLTRAVW
jgi:hypothetical protein